MKPFDFIIVGAGSAGCVLASGLTRDPRCRVLLVESGTDCRKQLAVQRPAEYLRVQNSNIDWSYETLAMEGLAGRKVSCPRGRTLGGSSAINAMIYHEGQPNDFVDWALHAGDQWSISQIENGFAELRGDAGNRLTIEQPTDLSHAGRAFTFAAAAACDAGTVDGEPEIYNRTTRAGVRQTAYDGFIGSKAPENLTVLEGATVQRLEIKNDCVAGIRIGHDASEVLLARQSVILAAGAIASPKLLLLSGIGPREDLESVGVDCRVDSPSVGKYLQDHLVFPVVFATPKQPAFPSRWSPSQLARWSYLGRGPISSNLAEAGGFFCDRSIQLHVTPTHYLQYPNPGAPSAMTIGVTASSPASRGSVSLASSDPDAHPLIDPGYLKDPADIETMVRGVQVAREIANTEPLASMVSGELVPGAKRDNPEKIARAIARYSMTLYHPVGGCQISEDPLSVADPQFRVRGVEGLRVADASVFPAIPKANPNATTMMIAHRAAILIAKDCGYDR